MLLNLHWSKGEFSGHTFFAPGQEILLHTNPQAFETPTWTWSGDNLQGDPVLVAMGIKANSQIFLGVQE